MLLARRAGEFAAAGALIVGVCADPVGANAAMTERLGLPFPVLSDPDGEGACKPYGVWSKEERRALTSLVALAPDGAEVFRYVGMDYADRPDEEEVLESVGALGLPPRPAPPGVHPHAAPRPTERAFAREELHPYLRGARSAAAALHGRTGDEQAGRVHALAERFLAAL